MRHEADRSTGRRWRTLRFATVAVIAASVVFCTPSKPVRQRVADAAATLRFRPSEARLSGEAAYHPVAPRYRGEHLPEAKNSLAFLAAAGALDDQSGADANTVDHLQESAAARIYLGEARAAVAGLERALQRAGAERLDPRKRARLWNDLAVAKLELVAGGEERRYLVDALDAAETAWAADPTNVSTAWTRALLLEKLSERRTAFAAWQQYLRLDNVSPWAAEARKHIIALSDRPAAETSFTDAEKARMRKALLGGDRAVVQELLTAFPTDSRLYGEDELLSEWASLHLRKLPADAILDAASELAGAIRSRTGDALLSDAVAQIAAADVASRDRLAAAIMDYKSARDAYRAKQVQVSLQRLEVAEQALRAVDSPMAIWANVYRFSATYSENKFGDALSVLSPSVDPCDGARRYYAACGVKSWIQGLVLVQNGHPVESLDSYERALAAFRAANEPDYAAVVLSLRAETLDFMSAADEAWADRMTGLKMFENRPMGARPLIWMIVAQAALRDHKDRAAAVILDEIAADARERADAMWYAEALLWRLIVTNRLEGKVGEADIDAARAAIAHITEPSTRARSQANLGLVLGEVQGSEPAARGDLDQALDFYRESEDRFNGTAALAQRAKVRATTADFEGAGADVVEALEEFQRQSEEIDDPLARTLFSERSRELFLVASRLQAEHDRPLAALWFSDRARESAVRQFQGEKGSSASNRDAEGRAQELVRRIAANVTVVHQDLDGDVLRTWAIRNGQVGFSSRTVNGALLRAEVAELRGLLQEGSDDGIVRRAKSLYDLLLRPERESFAGNGLLVYSPSAELRGLPIGVLHDGQRFLIEQRPIAVTRSVGSLAGAKLRSPGDAASVLVVNGAPTGGAPLLEGVERESAALARWYGARGSVLSGAEVTPRAFLDAAPRYDIIHVGAHARTDRRPLQNAIELDSGRRLRAFDVMNLTLPKAPIVVLGGCSTDDETTGRATLSLANAFAYAGASAVVGSLWDVEDTGAMHLLVQFHKELATNVYAPEALRRAQLTALRNHDPVTVWAAFQLHL